MKAYASDIAVIEQAIHEKRKKMGLDDSDAKFKLREIDLKLKEFGGRLEVPLLEDFVVPGDESESDASEVSEKSKKSNMQSRAGKSRATRRSEGKSRRSSNKSVKSQHSGDAEYSSKEHPYDKFFSKKVN